MRGSLLSPMVTVLVDRVLDWTHGYILGEAFKTMKLKREDREALRATLYTLVDTTPKLPDRRSRAHRGARP